MSFPLKQKYTFFSELLPTWYDPEEIFVRLYGKEPHAFWLDSSKVDEGFSRFSYMGKAGKVIRYSLHDPGDDIFSVLEHELNNIYVQKTTSPFAFTGGYVGYFGYELKKLCGYSHTFTSAYPDSLWYYIDRFFIFDHKEKKTYLGCLTQTGKDAREWFALVKKILSIQKNHEEKKKKIHASPLALELAKKEYLNAIHACKKYLKNGESYEICLTNRLRGETKNDPLDVYLSLRRTNPAPYAAFFRDNDFAVLCSSPERFLTIDQEGWVEEKPMKGTIGRSKKKHEDNKLKQQLKNSKKDQAENLMIVDLVRNDLGKVCEIGKVSVPELMQVETYQTVHQMVSTVRGKLRKNVSVIDCIKACFPGGSMTGAPKKRTIEILDSLEKSARGVYSGALGFLSANGAVDLNIVIRTMVILDGKVSIGTGGAITYQSDPKLEYEEMVLKTKALRALLTD